MKTNQELDQLLEDFLCDNHVADGEFTENVLASLPQQPRLVWLTHIYPILGLLAGLIAAWKVDVLRPDVVWVWAQKMLVYLNVNISSISLTVSVSVLIGLAFLAAYFVWEKIQEF